MRCQDSAGPRAHSKEPTTGFRPRLLMAGGCDRVLRFSYGDLGSSLGFQHLKVLER